MGHRTACVILRGCVPTQAPHQHQQEEQEQEQEQEPCTAVKVAWDTRAVAHSEASLRAAFGSFGAVQRVFLGGKKGGKAVVLLGAGAAERALAAGVDGFRERGCELKKIAKTELGRGRG
jgi:hypothetical protein